MSTVKESQRKLHNTLEKILVFWALDSILILSNDVITTQKYVSVLKVTSSVTWEPMLLSEKKPTNLLL